MINFINDWLHPITDKMPIQSLPRDSWPPTLRIKKWPREVNQYPRVLISWVMHLIRAYGRVMDAPWAKSDLACQGCVSIHWVTVSWNFLGSHPETDALGFGKEQISLAIAMQGPVPPHTEKQWNCHQCQRQMSWFHIPVLPFINTTEDMLINLSKYQFSHLKN